MRIVFALLADESHRLPVPGAPGSFFPAEGREVDADDPFWLACLRDGSLVCDDHGPIAPPAGDPAGADH